MNGAKVLSRKAAMHGLPHSASSSYAHSKYRKIGKMPNFAVTLLKALCRILRAIKKITTRRQTTHS